MQRPFVQYILFAVQFYHQTRSILTLYQHKFYKGSSTAKNLLHLTTLINDGFKEVRFTDAIYIYGFTESL